MSRVLLSDTWHFHRRNFASLLDTLDAGAIQWRCETRRSKWWKRHGDYTGLKGALGTVVDSLEASGMDAAFTATRQGLSLFEMAKGELFCLLLSRKHWRNYDGQLNDEALFQYAWKHDRKDLLLNLAAAQSWIHFWSGVLDEGWTHVVVFSGSYTYTRTLLALAAGRNLNTFVSEHFFTGNEFYVEPRSTPLPNNTSVGRSDTAYPLALPDDARLLERLRAEMHTRFAAMTNKNVKPESVLVPPPFTVVGKSLLIIGQVMNDFSLIENKPGPVFSLPIYRRLVQRVLADSDWRIVFKAHPWERKRPNLKSPVTRDAMARLRDSLPIEQQQRFVIEELAPIGRLLTYADQVVTICSQGGLEACQSGLKPAVLGRAFYDRLGFSSDFADADAFVDALVAGEVQGTLSLDEYRGFEDYMTKALLLDLYRNDALSQTRLHSLLSDTKPDWDWPALFTPPQEGPTLPSLADIVANPCPWLRDGVRWIRRILGLL